MLPAATEVFEVKKLEERFLRAARDGDADTMTTLVSDLCGYCLDHLIESLVFLTPSIHYQ